MKTVNEQIADLTARFHRLSDSRKARLKREALAFVASKPYAANHSTFWRGLSAIHILAA